MKTFRIIVFYPHSVNARYQNPTFEANGLQEAMDAIRIRFKCRHDDMIVIDNDAPVLPSDSKQCAFMGDD